MRFSLQREVFLKPLAQVVNVVERRQTLPVLANFLVQVQGGQLSLTGTDLEVEMIARSAVEDAVGGCPPLAGSVALRFGRLRAVGQTLRSIETELARLLADGYVRRPQVTGDTGADYLTGKIVLITADDDRAKVFEKGVQDAVKGTDFELVGTEKVASS